MINTILVGMLGLGGPELIMIAAVVMLMFGGKKIPELMKGLGRGIREFKDASTGSEAVSEEKEKNI